jgi:hypothetical protein
MLLILMRYWNGIVNAGLRRYKRGANQRSAYAATGKCPATESGH